MRIAHLTDLHLRQFLPGHSASNDRRSRQMAALLPEALERIRRQDVDLLVLTGDLLDAPLWLWEPTWGFETDERKPWLEAVQRDYELVKKLLDDSGLPYMVLPGNHDHEASFWRVFDRGDNIREVAGFKVVRFCDWEAQGRNPRRFSTERVRFNEALAATDGLPQVHVQHYLIQPAIRTGYSYAYLESDELTRRIVAAGCVKLSLSGHYHKGTPLTEVGGCVYSVAEAFGVAAYRWRVYEIGVEGGVSMTTHQLEVTQPSRPVVFLDRDGVINDLASYRTGAELMRLIPGSARAIRRLNDAGFAVVGITSQSCIGGGYVPESTVHGVHDKMYRLLSEEGAVLDAMYYSTNAGQDAVLPQYEDLSHCKPSPFHLNQARELLNLDFSRGWMVGDRHTDLLTGRNAGVRPVLVRTGNGRLTEQQYPEYVRGALVADDLAGAVDAILAQGQ